MLIQLKKKKKKKKRGNNPNATRKSIRTPKI